VSGPGFAFASIIACLNVLGPESAVEETFCPKDKAVVNKIETDKKRFRVVLDFISLIF
jgi:hypothetical protein